ncbi:MAG: tetratricopeptide repeat protein [Isosphaeraceae bacterium]
MGTVYRADQTAPVRRQVALKLIRTGMDSRAVQARFEAERQALALMDHPNIARVFDGGTTEAGQPFFVMELVEGEPITDHCDRRRLPVRDRLELFVSVCQAVQHAHQKGIIHRDLKPSNVLVAEVDGRPTPKVIDFGVAKAVEQRLTDLSFADTGAIVGTPAYMSPEQADPSSMDIDTRTDVYALGVILYELLTGSPPIDAKQFQRGAILEMLRMVREVDPQRPSTRLSTAEALPNIAANRNIEPARLSRLVQGELDWVVMKALEKDRARRYDTANGFASDIQRYLGDEVVEARPPSRGYRLRKFARRNRGLLATAAMVAAALLLGTAVATWQAVRARRAEKAALDAGNAALASAASEKAAKETAQAREAETRAVLDFVEGRVFAAARPEGQEGGLGYDVKLADAVRAALPFVESGFKDQPLVEARLRMTMGLSFRYLGEYETAMGQYERACALLEEHLGPGHPDTLRAKIGLLIGYERLGRIPEAIKLGEETLAIARGELGPDHPDTLSSMNYLANCYMRSGRLAEALKLYEESLALQRAKLGPGHPDTLISMGNLANAYRGTGRQAEALKLYEETLALRRAKLGPGHPITLTNMFNLANAYNEIGRRAEALKLFEETLALQKAKLGPGHPDTLMSMGNLVRVYEQAGRKAEVVKLYEETLALQRSKLGPDHPETLDTMDVLARSYSDAGRRADAVKLYEETLTLRRAKLGPDHPDTLHGMITRARTLNEVGRPAEGKKLLEESLVAIRKSRIGPNDGAIVFAGLGMLSDSLGKLGRQAEVIKLDEETLALARTKLGADHMYTQFSTARLLDNYLRRGRISEAINLGAETLTFRKAKFGPDDSRTLLSMQELAIAFSSAGRYLEALKLDEEALSLAKSRYGPGSPPTSWSMNRLARLLACLPDVRLRDPARSLELAAEATRLATANDQSACLGTLGLARYRSGDWKQSIADLQTAIGSRPSDDTTNATEAFFLAMAHWQLGEKEKAREWYGKAVAWMEIRDRDNPEMKRFRAEANALMQVEPAK